MLSLKQRKLYSARLSIYLVSLTEQAEFCLHSPESTLLHARIQKIFPEVEGVNRRPEWVPWTFGTESPNDTGEQKLLNGDVTDFKNIAVL